ncbi:MAG: amidohydrolase [Pseudomonadota bacterium]
MAEPLLFDTHQHLIYREAARYSWTVRAPILDGRDFTLDDYAALTKGLGVGGALFMEVDPDEERYQDETRFVAKAIDGSPTRGIIACCRPEHASGFDAWLEESAELGVVGYRRILHMVDDGVSQTETFRRNVRAIGQAGRTFDVVMHARQLHLALELMTVCPDTQFVLDHCGNPDIANNAMDPWADAMTQLAKLPNVVVKFSGLTVNCGPGQDPATAVVPYLHRMIDIFGPDRILWGGDWPVVDLAVGLPRWIAITRQVLATLSADEAAAIAHKTAERIYKVSMAA